MKDPTQHPAVDPGYLRHPADKAILAAGLRLFDKIIKNPNVKDMVGKRTTPPSDVDFQDIKQCERAVEELVLGQYHANGSCAMGAALDSRLRVNGVKGIRVCDASVFPADISGNIQGTVYAVGEIAADFIKEEYQL